MLGRLNGSLQPVKKEPGKDTVLRFKNGGKTEYEVRDSILNLREADMLV